jgi:hypothetical protein
MQRLLLVLVILATLARAETPAGWLLVEEEVAAEVAKPQITVVHFWAPWCPNSTAEHRVRGWATFLGSNPDVRFIFVTIRSSDDGYAYLAGQGVKDQPNLRRLHHPNHVRKGEGSIQNFMDIPLSWVPSTWVFRDGKLRYALNYGEVRFPLLQQLIRDAADEWAH